jgi:hypothetical protein
LNTVHNPATGTVAPAAWGDQVRDNLEFLVDPPTCSVEASSDVTLADNSTTALAAATENFDNDSMHSTVSNTSRITIQTAGRYLFLATVRFDAASGSGAGIRRVSLRVDGTTSYGGMQAIGATTNQIRIQATRSLVLAAGQYVETTALSIPGGGQTTPVHLDEFFVMFLTR